MRLHAVATAALFAAALFLKPDAATAQAQDPDALKVAQELVDLTVTDGVRTAMIEGSWPEVENMLRTNPLRLTDSEIAALKSDFSQLLRKELDDTMNDTPEIYAKYLSAAELRDMLAFYQTETGRKSLAVLPAMTAEIMQRTNDRAPAMMQRIMVSFGELLKKRGVKTP